MTVRHDDSVPVRSIEVEVEVPGTPEQVWEAIATGPGVTAWFCPTTIEERKGGAVAFRMAPGMESKAVVTAWEPPRRFAAEELDGMPGAPPSATEFFVEAKAGGTCRVRVVNSLFTSKADWDDQLEGLEKGWPTFLEILRLYLTHFAGEPCTPLQAVTITAMDDERAWNELLAGLQLAGAGKGERRSTAGSAAPRFTGTVETVRDSKTIVVRTEEPAPGLAVFGVAQCGPAGLMVWGSFFLYGESAADLAAGEEAKWQAWLGERFPAPAAAVATTAAPAP